MIASRKKNRIFCISFQRTGTTSVGKFFKDFGYSSAGWIEARNNKWGRSYFDGDFGNIFNSSDFKKNSVFEDGPWGIGSFYKNLFHKFPDSQFVFFTRDANKWFDSMVSHSKGKTLGNTFFHCNIYNRESEYYKFMGDRHKYQNCLVDNLMPLGEEQRKKYVEIYNNRNRQIVDFFKSKDPLGKRFIHLELESEDKWRQLGSYFKINVPEGYGVHANKS